MKREILIRLAVTFAVTMVFVAGCILAITLLTVALQLGIDLSWVVWIAGIGAFITLFCISYDLYDDWKSPTISTMIGKTMTDTYMNQYGQTAKEWAADLFSDEICCECGGGERDHDIILFPFKDFFARCIDGAPDVEVDSPKWAEWERRVQIRQQERTS